MTTYITLKRDKRLTVNINIKFLCFLNKKCNDPSDKFDEANIATL